MGGSKLKIGEIRYNTYGTPMKIINVKKNQIVEIQFLDEHGVIKESQYQNFKNGCIKNPYDRNVRGVGYFGEGVYTATDKNNPYVKRAFQVWSTMLERCHKEESRERFPAYGNCLVCDEWHNYQNFRKWYDENYYEVGTERMHIDKDILYKNNRVYSPTTCLIVPQRINMLFVHKPNKDNLPNGINKTKSGKFRVRYNGKELGYFNSVEEGAIIHDKEKKKAIIQIANEYRNLVPERVYHALINWIPDYIDYNEYLG